MLYRSRFIPIGITDMAQPMDVSVMRVFMKRCRELYVAHHIDNDFTPDPVARRDLITRVVVQAWDGVPVKPYRGFLFMQLFLVGNLAPKSQQ
ncbi:hypothetical protein F442_00275 [Phytophthora nicotianae P10297]|uniref:DDE-1 domain-containing protein n=1 Tax=Phytophthora nicotianae P10297 TaxID=1317064 RepID=W3A7E7_PHYNI|nr:hypothetical protein F442_00275 [Phytophthora nicotianae P10297]